MGFFLPLRSADVLGNKSVIFKRCPLLQVKICFVTTNPVKILGNAIVEIRKLTKKQHQLIKVSFQNFIKFGPILHYLSSSNGFINIVDIIVDQICNISSEIKRSSCIITNFRFVFRTRYFSRNRSKRFTCRPFNSVMKCISQLITLICFRTRTVW